ncbi:uncharacterized protein LOC124419579 [Lucilia cuprina]|uniref:uncharacterized protein LOC124419579 n=1 Tax=Lucilia cuprina TaxID=7375 RepID=UPI001F070688|nr:uncharacterized protein LOC124419579 [Lucilia cuprina]
MYIHHKNMNDISENIPNGSTVPGGVSSGTASTGIPTVNDLNTNSTFKSSIVIDNQPKRRVSIASDPAAEGRHVGGYDNPAFEQNPRRKISQVSVSELKKNILV